MAINQDIINASWEGQPKSSIEAGLKALLQRMLEVLEGPLAANSVGSDQLTQALRDAIDSIGSKVPNTRTVNGIALSENITIGPDRIMVGTQTLADKLDDMDEAIGRGSQGDTSGHESRIAALEQALDDLTGVEDTTQIIDTFKEVIDFLANVNNDETLLGKLQQLQNQINSKANSSDLQNYATKNELTSGLGGKQNTLTYDTTPTAGHTTQVMSSDSIKTAIDLVTPTINENGKWVIGGVTTTHDAHGPQGDTLLVDGNTDVISLIVNNLTTGGAGNILSAEMGKALLSVLLQIFGNLGNYAFPNGKPTLNFNTQISFPISYSQSDQHVTYADGQGGTAPTTVDLLGRLEIQLGTNNDLYVIKESAVKVFVGGTEVSGAYDPTTDKIIIPEVYGNVVIIAEAWTYVQDGLVLHLDGRHGRTVPNRWDSQVNYNNSPLYFKLENCIESNSDYVAGNGNDSKGTAFSDTAFTSPVTLLDVGADEGVIEAVYSHAEIASNGNLPIMHNAYGNQSVGNRICLTSWHPSRLQETENTLVMCTSPGLGVGSGIASDYLKADINAGGYVSLKKGSFMFNGEEVAASGDAYQTTNSSSMLSIFARYTTAWQYSKLRLYSLRVYGTKQDGTSLTDTDRARNLAIDRKRFNLS